MRSVPWDREARAALEQEEAAQQETARPNANISPEPEAHQAAASKQPALVCDALSDETTEEEEEA